MRIWEKWITIPHQRVASQPAITTTQSTTLPTHSLIPSNISQCPIFLPSVSVSATTILPKSPACLLNNNSSSNSSGSRPSIIVIRLGQETWRWSDLPLIGSDHIDLFFFSLNPLLLTFSTHSVNLHSPPVSPTCGHSPFLPYSTINLNVSLNTLPLSILRICPQSTHTVPPSPTNEPAPPIQQLQ